MPCNDLKDMLELYRKSSVDSTARTFAAWEYMNLDYVFPSPRQMECYAETGYLKNDILRCKDSASGSNCKEYFIPRDVKSKIITFPDDFFYIDPSGKRYDDPILFVDDYFPKMKTEWTIR